MQQLHLPDDPLTCDPLTPQQGQSSRSRGLPVPDAPISGEDLRWIQVQYDQQQASAYAIMNLNDCTPFCYNGHEHRRPVRLHFFHNKDGRLTIGDVFYLNGGLFRADLVEVECNDG